MFPLSGCLYSTDDGVSLFKPYYLDRDRIVEDEDIQILAIALDLLADENQWNRKDDRLCFYEEKWSLFCALAKASTEVNVNAEYRHRRVALQEVRFTIDDNFADRWRVHKLMEFNNHSDTSFKDIRQVLLESKKRLEARYKLQNN